MGQQTLIEWCDHTFNPWIGCTKVSAACDHCYAEQWDVRFGGGHWGPHAPRRVTSDRTWQQPLMWHREAAQAGARRRVFCASLADVFDSQAPEGARDRLWALIRATPQLDWLLLTKRPQTIRAMLPDDWVQGYANVWLGATTETQDELGKRVFALLAVPAVVHFLSCEPLLGPLDLTTVVRPPRHPVPTDVLRGTPRIDWVICGGESGRMVRPMAPAWAQSLRDQCQAAHVGFFFKQWGGSSQRKKAAGRLLDGRTWDELPQARPGDAPGPMTQLAQWP